MKPADKKASDYSGGLVSPGLRVPLLEPRGEQDPEEVQPDQGKRDERQR